MHVVERLNCHSNLANGGLSRGVVSTSREGGQVYRVSLYYHQSSRAMGPPVQYHIIGTILGHSQIYEQFTRYLLETKRNSSTGSHFPVKNESTKVQTLGAIKRCCACARL